VLHAGDNRWKLADFGIARLPDSDLTQVGIFMGTPGYSPPEAIREGRYTPQADVFAWGAVFYELLSGRIPYEGPDTKTTNSYVVQGNAAPVSRHDLSIPDPLVEVTMTALQPSDKVRFKDASEAEQALRDAWNRCLTQNIVQSAVLTMEEMAHDKVGPRMHEVRMAKPSAQIKPVIGADSAEVTAIDSDMLAAAAAVASASAAAEASPLHIESGRKARSEDDDPTTIVVREELKAAKSDGTTRGYGMGASSSPGAERRTEKSGVQARQGEPSRRGDESGAPTIEEKAITSTASERRVGAGSKVIWIAIALVLLVAAGIAAAHYLGIIK
jgi:serine/threonine-protein kinase